MRDPLDESSNSELFADFLQALAQHRGAEFLERHPEAAAELEQLRQDMERLRGWRQAADLSSLGPDHTAAIDDSTAQDAARRIAALHARLMQASVRTPRYEPRARLGIGGMGEVVEAHDVELRRPVAVKYLRADKCDPDQPLVYEQYLLRLIEEAQITAQLAHPGIVPVFELGVDSSGRVYFSMAKIAGEDLHSIFRKVRDAEDGWSRTRALAVFLRVCETVAYAHSRGVVHRDLKPSNVMVGSYGEVYVVDWGLARIVNAEEAAGVAIGSERRDRSASSSSDLHSTQHDRQPGTVFYMSPEQASGATHVHPQWDVYALGAMLYELCVGNAPYGGPASSRTHQEEVKRRLQSGPPAPIEREAPDTPKELVAICRKAMARDRDVRYVSIEALRSDLSAHLEGHVVGAYQSGRLAQAKKWVRRNPVLSSTVMVAALLAMGFFSTWREARAADSKSKSDRFLLALRGFRDRTEVRELEAKGVSVEAPDSSARHDIVSAVLRDWDSLLEEHQLGAVEDVASLTARVRRLLPRDLNQQAMDSLYMVATLVMSREIKSPGAALTATDRDHLSALTLAGVVRDLETNPWRRQQWERWSQLLAEPIESRAELLADWDRESRSADDILWLAELCWRSAPSDVLIPIYERAARDKPDSYRAHERLSALYPITDSRKLLHGFAATVLRPDSSVSWFNFGVAQAAAGDRDGAVGSYERAIRINPALGVAYANLALLIPRPQGIVLLRDAQDKALGRYTLFLNLSYLCLDAHDFEGALDAASRGVDEYPEEHVLHFNRGRALQELGRNAEAVTAFERAVDLRPDFWDAWSNASYSSMSVGAALPSSSPDRRARMNDSLKFASEASRLRPNDPTSCRNVVAACFYLGDYALALDNVERFLGRSRDTEEILRFLETDLVPILEAESSTILGRAQEIVRGHVHCENAASLEQPDR